jgi:hypothetical protein
MAAEQDDGQKTGPEKLRFPDWAHGKETAAFIR